MGYALIPVIGISVAPTDREAGPNAGPGASGNRCIFFGDQSGFNFTPSDTVVIGNAALSAGYADTTNWTGGVVIGSGAAAAAATNGSVGTGGLLAIGYKAVTLNTIGSSSVAVGNFALSTLKVAGAGTPYMRDVTIGHEAAFGVTCNIGGVRSGDWQDNVALGYRVAALNGGTGMIKSVVIGSTALSGGRNTGGTNLTYGIFIGYGCGLNYDAGSAGTTMTVVGTLAANTQSGSGQVIIGYAANSTATGNTTGCTVVGASANAGQYNTAIGNAALCGSGAAGGTAPSVVLGYASGQAAIGRGITLLGGNIQNNLTNNRVILLGMGNQGFARDDIFLLETNDSGTRRCAMLAALDVGDVIIGKSTTGVDRDFQGTNTLKIINGTIGGANPIGGGYFYVNAGALHWVGSAGTDTTVAPA